MGGDKRSKKDDCPEVILSFKGLMPQGGHLAYPLRNINKIFKGG